MLGVCRLRFSGLGEGARALVDLLEWSDCGVILSIFRGSPRPIPNSEGEAMSATRAYDLSMWLEDWSGKVMSTNVCHRALLYPKRSKIPWLLRISSERNSISILHGSAPTSNTLLPAPYCEFLTHLQALQE